MMEAFHDLLVLFAWFLLVGTDELDPFGMAWLTFGDSGTW